MVFLYSNVFFFTLNSCPVFSTILSLLLPIFNFLSQFQVYFLAQRGKNIQWCLQIKPFFWGPCSFLVFTAYLLLFFYHFIIVFLILQILLVSINKSSLIRTSLVEWRSRSNLHLQIFNLYFILIFDCDVCLYAVLNC